MDQPVAEPAPVADRRRHPRRNASALVAAGLCTRLRSGHELTLVDVSASGVLVEGACRPLPGATVELQFVADGWRHAVTGRVVRCSVVALHPERGARYRAAVAFNAGAELPPLLRVRSG